MEEAGAAVSAFSGDELPDAWKQDLEGNIRRHQDKASLLRRNLQKEEAYISYLQQLLADAEARKSLPQLKSDNEGQDQQQAPEDAVPSDELCEDIDDVAEEITPPTESTDPCATPAAGSPGNPEDSSGFVTVISVGNRHKGRAVQQGSAEDGGESRSSPSTAAEEAGGVSEGQQRSSRPQLPPKNFRRHQSHTGDVHASPRVGNVAKSESFGFGSGALKGQGASSAEQNSNSGELKPLQDAMIHSSNRSVHDKMRTFCTPPAKATRCGAVDSDNAVDDEYGGKDQSLTSPERRSRAPLRIPPPSVPVQKSLSKDSLAIEKIHRDSLPRFASKDNLSKCASRESLTKFLSRENIAKFASKESLKDSGTSSPRNMSPKFFESKVSRSASQSSSSSNAPTTLAAASVSNYMEDIVEPLYDTDSTHRCQQKQQGVDYDDSTIKSTGSCDLDLLHCPSSQSYNNDTLRSEASAISGISGVSGISSTSSGCDSPRVPLPRHSRKQQEYVNVDFLFRKRVSDMDVERSPVNLRRHSCSLAHRHGVIDPNTEVNDLTFEGQTSAVLGDVDEHSMVSTARADDEPPGTSDSPARACEQMVELVDEEESSVGQTAAVEEEEEEERRFDPEETSIVHDERVDTLRRVVSSVLRSEEVYVECLSVSLQYMQALKATITTSQPLISREDFTSIFFKIPHLHSVHSEFLTKLRLATRNWDGRSSIGECFKFLAENMGIYGAFLLNYRHAVDTVRRCCANDAKFAEITRSIKLRSLQGQVLSLEELLHRPVARVHQAAPVLNDVLKLLPSDHADHRLISLAHALTMTQDFLTTRTLPGGSAVGEGESRHVVKNSFVVEMVDNQRKLRQLFLFNDVLVCAKYKAASRADKAVLDLKWFLSLADIEVLECHEVNGAGACDASAIYAADSAVPDSQLMSLRSQASTVREQIRSHERYAGLQGKQKPDSRNEKHKKKLSELETQLMLIAPNLPLKVTSKRDSKHTASLFFFSSEFERDQWTATINKLQDDTPPSMQTVMVSQYNLEQWMTSNRRQLQASVMAAVSGGSSSGGGLVLREQRSESPLVGDLHLLLRHVSGLSEPAEMFVCVEVDSYGNFFRKAKTCNSHALQPCWSEDFILELNGSSYIRLLCYQIDPVNGQPVLRGHSCVELSRSWLRPTMREHAVNIDISGAQLHYGVKYATYEMTMRRPPPGKNNALFGRKICHVCRREKRSVPFIITCCVREVERRGMHEMGVYRVSGSASSVAQLKKLFETNIYWAEQMLREVDIHSVTGLLKLYLRELPEALFTDGMYDSFFEAFSGCPPEERPDMLLQLFSQLPQLNQSIIVYLIEHMIRVHSGESHNKMSLHNLATVFGPTLMRPAAPSSSFSLSSSSHPPQQPDLLAAGTLDVMAQAGILYFFLQRRAHGQPIQMGSAQSPS